MVRVSPSDDSDGPFMMLTKSGRLMGKVRCFFTSGSGRVLWGVAFVYLFLISATYVFAQGFGSGSNLNKEQMISQAAEEIQTISDDILAEYVSKNIPLETRDIQQIGIRLKVIIRYQGVFNNEQRSYLYLVRAFLSHYSRGSADEVIEWAQKAYNSSPKNPDTVDSLIALALYHGRYDLAKGVMGKYKAGEAVMLAPDIPVERISMSSLRGGIGGDPNTAFSPGGRKPTTQLRQSRWMPNRSRERNLGSRYGGDFSSQGSIEVESEFDSFQDAGRNVGFGRSSSGGSSLDRSGGKLGLPLEYMPANMLGESFSSVHIRTVNGGSFQYDGRGGGRCFAHFCGLFLQRSRTQPFSQGGPISIVVFHL